MQIIRAPECSAMAHSLPKSTCQPPNGDTDEIDLFGRLAAYKLHTFGCCLSEKARNGSKVKRRRPIALLAKCVGISAYMQVVNISAGCGRGPADDPKGRH